MSVPTDELATAFGAIAVRAGVPIMALYGRAVPRAKADASLVTDADMAAEALILEALQRLIPDIPVLSEEQAAAGILPPDADTFIAVDPLDGTSEFLRQNGEFTVNIALIEHGRPVCGAVYAPAQRRLWTGATRAHRYEIESGASLKDATAQAAIRVRPVPAEGMVAVVSRSHGDSQTDAFLATLPVAHRTGLGSSLKFCCVAEGLADLYPRFGPTTEWDTAAGDAVLRAAGGATLTPEGESFRYGKRALAYRNGPFVAWGSPTTRAE